MKIVLLAHNLRVAGGLSVGRNIVSMLPEIAPMHEYLVFVPTGCGYPGSGVSSNVKVVEVPPMSLPKRIAFDLLHLPRYIKKFKPDWIWGLGNTGLRRPPCKQAILFHDSHLIYPESHFSFESWGYKFKKRLVRKNLRKCLPKTTLVFCQTETTKRRFSDTFAYNTDQISLCPNAVSKFSKQLSEPQTPPVLRPYADRFKLFVLTKCCGHKNINGIVDMYSKHREALAGTLCILTIAADQHAIAPGIIRRIKQENLGDLILNVGPLKQEELGDYFHASDALFFPTLLESFSGTYLEAMHFKRLIITSDLDFAHDVCGSAAAYCDPFDTESMCDTILNVQNSPAKQEQLVAKGNERLKTFFRSWENILRDALDAMNVPHEQQEAT